MVIHISLGGGTELYWLKMWAYIMKFMMKGFDDHHVGSKVGYDVFEISRLEDPNSLQKGDF